MSISDKLTAIAENEQKVFEAGAKSEYDRFWDAYQQKGNRVNYQIAFAGSGWNSETLKPKYPIVSTYCFEMFRSCGEVDLTKAGVPFDFSQSTSFSNFAYASEITHFGEINTTGSNALSYTFYNCSKLTTIDKLILKANGSQTMGGNQTFQGCGRLENIVVEGVIGSSINFQWSPLSVESMKSIISALKDFTGTGNEYSQTVKFSNDCWAALEADGTAPDGGTWKAYVQETLSWNI